MLLCHMIGVVLLEEETEKEPLGYVVADKQKTVSEREKRNMTCRGGRICIIISALRVGGQNTNWDTPPRSWDLPYFSTFTHWCHR